VPRIPFGVYAGVVAIWRSIRMTHKIAVKGYFEFQVLAAGYRGWQKNCKSAFPVFLRPRKVFTF